MAVQELSRTQLAELKQHFLIRLPNLHPQPESVPEYFL